MLLVLKPLWGEHTHGQRGLPQLRRKACSCSKAGLGKSLSRREDLGSQATARVCFQCRKAGELISAM